MPHESGTGGELPSAAIPPEALDLARDRQLVDAVLRKDRKATAQLVALYADAVHAFVRHRMPPRPDRVEDLVHDVFLAALSGLAGFRSQSTLRSWLLGIARHKVEDYYRRVLREPEPFDDSTETADMPAAQLSVEEKIDRARAAERTRLVLSMLPENYGAILLWRYWDNRSTRDIAEMTGRTEKSVERLLARARVRFREIWKEMKR